MLDIIMITLFVIFMIWIINGFNKNQIDKHIKRMEDAEKNKQDK